MEMAMDRQRHFHASTNNSATRIYMVHDGDTETGCVLITAEVDLYKALQPHRGRPTSSRILACNGHNVDESVDADKIEIMLRAVFSDRAFREKYSYQSLFLIGAGAYGHVFRVVTNASGPVENPRYNADYVRFLQGLRKTRSRQKVALLDSYRDSLCLDLVAVKVEVLTATDIEFQSANKIQLAKEFCVLAELFRNHVSSNALVGFPLPIEFGYLGSHRAAKDLRKVMVFDTYGRPSNYQDTYLADGSTINVTAQDVTLVSYMTMELVGPNLDEWKTFFQPKRSGHGQVVFSVQTTLKLMDQVLCRLLVMHRKNMVHLDLKPDNICMGIGKMSNTVYLLDYGLSRVCSDDRPNITMGSRRYMSVGVLNLEPANYMMDIESWFYILVVLLTDFVPWSDEILTMKLGRACQDDQDQRMLLMSKMKKQFWGDEGTSDKKMVQQVIDKVEAFHNANVPDIGALVMDIYLQIMRMRKDFHRVSSLRMHADITNEDSDLFKRYHTLRKLLLFPYDCDFTGKGSCFAGDKDLHRKQEKRRVKHAMLVFAEKGRNWQWDWDVWFEKDFVQKNRSKNLNNAATSAAAAAAVVQASATTGEQRASLSPQVVARPPTVVVEEESAEMPDWMRHYLARVLGSMGPQSSTGGEGVFNPQQTLGSDAEPEGILVA